MKERNPQFKFQVGDIVLAEGKIGAVVQYRKNETVDPKDKSKKIIAGDGRTTVAFFQFRGEEVSFKKIALPEDKVTLACDPQILKQAQEKIVALEAELKAAKEEIAKLKDVAAEKAEAADKKA